MAEVLESDTEKRQARAVGKTELGATILAETHDQVHEDSGEHTRDW